MNWISRLSRLFDKPEWKPRQGIVYKSWSKGDSHFGKSANVTILYDHNEYNGTFSVNAGICEIRIGEGEWKYGLEHGSLKLCNVRRLITSAENVSFKKAIRHIDTISTLGQNGYAGTEITYVAELLNPKIVEEKPLQCSPPEAMTKAFREGALT